MYGTSTSLFTGGSFYLNLNNIHEYLIQNSLKSGTKDHFWVKVPGTERPAFGIIIKIPQKVDRNLKSVWFIDFFHMAFSIFFQLYP